MQYLQFSAGLILLLVGAEMLVGAAVRLARAVGLSPLIIGLTLVGFGTSLPELVASLHAAMRDSPGIAVGNVVGSNITNVLLIIGLVAVLSPIACLPAVMRRDGAVMVLTAVLCVAVLLIGDVGRGVGVAFLLGLAAYVTMNLTAGAHDRVGKRLAADKPVGTGVRHNALALLSAFAGLAVLILGADMLVDGAIDIASELGVPESIVGLTVVAIGTSLPELFTSLVAAARRQTEIAIGNIIGSNIFNILGILGVTAVIKPVPVPGEVRQYDGYVMLAATLLFIAAAISGRRISRGEGILFVLLYLAYLAFLDFRLPQI